jgi:hypothetical protein
MLDYAANAVVYWPIEQIRVQFENTCQSKGLVPDEVISDFLNPENNPEEFWEKIKTNLQAGKIRLVFVADKIPSELQRVVEFLNSQMDPAEVLALEVKQYVGQGVKTMVPKIIGLTAAVQQKKSSGTREIKRWDEPSFFQELQARRGVDESGVARKILEWAQAGKLRIWWGQGKRYGSFIPMFDYQGRGNFLISVWTYGTIEVQFQWMQTRLPFAEETKRLELLNRLNQIKGINLSVDSITKRPSLPLANFKDFAVLQEFLNLLDWVIQEIKLSASAVE